MVDHLRDACMEQLTRSPGERRKEILLDVLDDPALRSSLLPNITIRSMIQRLSTRALREIESQGSIFVYHEVVSRELSSELIGMWRVVLLCGWRRIVLRGVRHPNVGR